MQLDVAEVVGKRDHLKTIERLRTARLFENGSLRNRLEKTRHCLGAGKSLSDYMYYSESFVRQTIYRIVCTAEVTAGDRNRMIKLSRLYNRGVSRR